MCFLPHILYLDKKSTLIVDKVHTNVKSNNHRIFGARRFEGRLQWFPPTSWRRIFAYNFAARKNFQRLFLENN